MKRKRLKVLIILGIILFNITIGYAILSSNLSINGITLFNNPTWNIHFENIQEISGSVEPNSTPVISNDGLTVSYSVNLSKPGDYYEFTVDVVNSGSIDAMIESIESKMNNQIINQLPNHLEYSIEYADGIEIVENQLLAADTTETVRVHIGFKKDINASDLPSTDQSNNFSFSITYIQATDDQIPIREPEPVDIDTLIFTGISPSISFDFLYVSIGSPLPAGLDTYDNFYDAVNNIGSGGCVLGHKIENGIVKEMYFVFIYNYEVYAIQAGINESNSPRKPVFDANRNILDSVFDNCSLSLIGYTCEVSPYHIYITDSGEITWTYAGFGCWFNNNSAYCA